MRSRIDCEHQQECNESPCWWWFLDKKTPANGVQVVDKVEDACLCEDDGRHYHRHLLNRSRILSESFYETLDRYNKWMLPWQSLTPSQCPPQWTQSTWSCQSSSPTSLSCISSGQLLLSALFHCWCCSCPNCCDLPNGCCCFCRNWCRRPSCHRGWHICRCPRCQ